MLESSTPKITKHVIFLKEMNAFLPRRLVKLAKSHPAVGESICPVSKVSRMAEQQSCAIASCLVIVHMGCISREGAFLEKKMQGGSIVGGRTLT